MKYLSLSGDEKNRPRTYKNGCLIADKAAYAAAEKVSKKIKRLKPPKRIKTRTVILLTLWWGTFGFCRGSALGKP